MDVGTDGTSPKAMLWVSWLVLSLQVTSGWVLAHCGTRLVCNHYVNEKAMFAVMSFL